MSTAPDLLARVLVTTTALEDAQSSLFPFFARTLPRGGAKFTRPIGKRKDLAWRDSHAARSKRSRSNRRKAKRK